MENRRQFLKDTGLLAIAVRAFAIVIENAENRLVLSPTGAAQSLIHKASGQECLAPGLNVPMFTVTQHRPYDNELQLAYPAKPKAFPAESVRRDGNRLIVQFSLFGYEASIQLRITDAYIGLHSTNWNTEATPACARRERR